MVIPLLCCLLEHLYPQLHKHNLPRGGPTGFLEVMLTPLHVITYCNCINLAKISSLLGICYTSNFAVASFSGTLDTTDGRLYNHQF